MAPPHQTSRLKQPTNRQQQVFLATLNMGPVPEMTRLRAIKYTCAPGLMAKEAQQVGVSQDQGFRHAMDRRDETEERDIMMTKGEYRLHVGK